MLSNQVLSVLHSVSCRVTEWTLVHAPVLHSVSRCWVIEYCLCIYIYATLYQHVLSNQVLFVLHSVSCRVIEWTLVHAPALHSVSRCWVIEYCLCIYICYPLSTCAEQSSIICVINSVSCRVIEWTLVPAPMLHYVSRCWVTECCLRMCLYYILSTCAEE